MSKPKPDPTARERAAAVIAVALGRGWGMISRPETVDTLDRKTCVLVQTSVEKKAIRAHQRTLDLYVVTPGPDEAELERALDEVLEALDAAKIGWTVATRAVFQQQYPCYLIPLTARTTIITEE